MAAPPLCVSARPNERALRVAAAVSEGVEVKLDWDHLKTRLREQTLSECCDRFGVNYDRIVSVHLPPGTRHRHGMSLAPGKVGRIADFTHSRFGEVTPRFLTIHSVRQFDYRDQLRRAATLSELTGYQFAIENTPDESFLHTPVDLGLFSYLLSQHENLSDVALLVDTAHVPTNRMALSTADDEIERALGRLDDHSRAQMEAGFREFVSERSDVRSSLTTPTDADPWQPVLTALAAIGGDLVRAVHLNDPVTDGLPTISGSPTAGFEAVLDFCADHDVTVILEPDTWERSTISDTVEHLAALLS